MPDWDTAIAFAVPIAWLVIALATSGDYANTDGCGHVTTVLSNFVFPPLAFALLAVQGRPRAALGVVAAMFMQSGIVHVIKRRTAVVRPNGDPYSYPSGHAASAATISYYALFAFLPNCVKHPGCGLLLVSVTFTYAWHASCCRINEGMHYTSDLAASHVIALVLTYAILQLDHRNHGALVHR